MEAVGRLKPELERCKIDRILHIYRFSVAASLATPSVLDEEL
jgi:hypothetical protein